MVTVIEKTATYVREALEGEGSGHDWWHVYRVWKSACNITQGEDVDEIVVQLGALLHDIADHKFHGGDHSVGPRVAREWLEKNDVEEKVIAQVCTIIEEVSFRGAKVKTTPSTKEGMVVQDADRLDAMGAIGIGRAFAYGGYKGLEMYNPEQAVEEHDSFASYKKNESSSINHFYEKLLLLKDRMNTSTGKRLAERRHAYMEGFLEEFMQEWKGT